MKYYCHKDLQTVTIEPPTELPLLEINNEEPYVIEFTTTLLPENEICWGLEFSISDTTAVAALNAEIIDRQIVIDGINSSHVGTHSLTVVVTDTRLTDKTS